MIAQKYMENIWEDFTKEMQRFEEERMKKISRPSQENQILQYMREHKEITGLDAQREFGCMRLPARISVLEDQGYKFTRESIKVRNQNGEHVRVTAYGLLEEEP